MQTKAHKSVKFRYTPSASTIELLRTFRDMVNDAIRICLSEKISGRLQLRNRIYKDFQKRYRLLTGYPYSVAEVAWSIVKKHQKWGRKPIAKKLMMKMDVQNYSVNNRILSIPFRREEHVVIQMEYGDYQEAFLANQELKRGSLTITESAAIIAFSRIMTPLQPLARVGIDLNEKSVVSSDGSKYDLSDVTRLRTEYASRRSAFDRENPNDRRLRSKFSGSRRERERVKQVLHKTAKRIVESAKMNSKAIVLEQLRRIQQSHRRGNGEGKRRRRRFAVWPFRVLQDYIACKAAWDGVQVEYVNPAWTTKTCHECSFVNRALSLTDREWRCPNCGVILDRDLNAAINIERRGTIACLGEVRPGAQGTDETMRGNEATTAPILRAEAPKSTLRPSKGKPLDESLGAQNQWS